MARIAKSIRLWPLRHQDPLPTYVKGRTVLLGDAAHAMTPTQSQGANQAIEDADGLRLLNTGSVSRENVHEVLKQWVSTLIHSHSLSRLADFLGTSATSTSVNCTEAVFWHSVVERHYDSIQTCAVLLELFWYRTITEAAGCRRVT